MCVCLSLPPAHEVYGGDRAGSDSLLQQKSQDATGEDHQCLYWAPRTNLCPPGPYIATVCSISVIYNTHSGIRSTQSISSLLATGQQESGQRMPRSHPSCGQSELLYTKYMGGAGRGGEWEGQGGDGSGRGKKRKKELPCGESNPGHGGESAGS